jgi:uroporphyrinogen-III synthase
LQVWVTRAEPGAAATAERLRARGHTPLVAPLLAVRALKPPDRLPAGTGALAFTSANGVRAFCAWAGERNLPVFAVGAATAASARAAGFTDVTSAEGDVEALAELIARAGPPGAVVHAGGRERAGDLPGRLAPAGVQALALALYETIAASALPEEAGAALAAAALDAVLLHSPKAARVLAAVLAGRPERERAGLRAVGLSQACLRPLEALGLAGVAAASTPDEAALLERLA